MVGNLKDVRVVETCLPRMSGVAPLKHRVEPAEFVNRIPRIRNGQAYVTFGAGISL